MELKTKYEYTYFIYPYVIDSNKYSKYMQKLLKNKNCKLRLIYLIQVKKLKILSKPFSYQSRTLWKILNN